MPLKTFQPRIDRDSDRTRSSDGGDPINAHIRKFWTERRAHMPIATSSRYVTQDGESDNDLDYIDAPTKREPEMIRPEITKMRQTLEKFNDPNIANVDPEDPRSWVECPICSKCATPDRWKMLEHFVDSATHPETHRYYRFLLDKVQSPHKNWNEQLRIKERQYDDYDHKIKKLEELALLLKQRHQKIVDKYGIEEARRTYGEYSTEYEIAVTKASEALEPIEKGLKEAKEAMNAFVYRRNLADREANFFWRKLEEMKKDKFIAPLLVPVHTGSSSKTKTEKKKMQFEIDLEMMEPLARARFEWEQRQKFGVSSPIPSKGALYRDENKYSTEEIQRWLPDAWGNNYG
jgi:hypothetical protein